MELTFDMGWKMAEALLAGVAAIGGVVFRAYAVRQRDLSEAHSALQKSHHALDVRLTAAEASLHATKNNVTVIHEELQGMREEIRSDLRAFIQQITERIDNIVTAPRRPGR